MPLVAVPYNDYQQFLPQPVLSSPSALPAPSTPTHTSATPTPSKSPSPPPYVSNLPEDNAYTQASWAEVFARVIQVLKRDKVRQKVMAVEVSLSGSTLSSMLHGKYKHTKEVHIDRLRDWCYDRDTALVDKLIAAIESDGLTNNEWVVSVGLDHDTYTKYLDFTLPIHRRHEVDTVITPWLRNFLLRQNTIERQQEQSDASSATSASTDSATVAATGVATGATGVARHMLGLLDQPPITPPSTTSLHVTSSSSSSSSSALFQSPVSQSAEGVPEEQQLLQLLRSYQTTVENYPPVRATPPPTPNSTPVPHKQWAIEERRTIEPNPLLLFTQLAERGVERAVSPAEMMETGEHIQDESEEELQRADPPPIEESKQPMNPFMDQPTQQATQSSSANANALFEHLLRQQHQTDAPPMQQHLPKAASVKQETQPAEVQEQQSPEFLEEEQEEDEIALSFDSFLSK
jgi:hypothetical protein